MEILHLHPGRRVHKLSEDHFVGLLLREREGGSGEMMTVEEKRGVEGG